ncbi:MAG: 30S ribosomal protein S20 [Deltaproteobacteria bacterium]|nr:30S ribosomal protein S20 [Deltaproteobacteria bacterium]
MANHASALKRDRQSRLRRLRNAGVKTRVKTAVKKLEHSLDSGAAESARPLLIQAVSLIDRAGSKGVLHPRNASRKISRLSKKAHKQLGAAV